MERSSAVCVCFSLLSLFLKSFLWVIHNEWMKETMRSIFRTQCGSHSADFTWSSANLHQVISGETREVSAGARQDRAETLTALTDDGAMQNFLRDEVTTTHLWCKCLCFLLLEALQELIFVGFLYLEAKNKLWGGFESCSSNDLCMAMIQIWPHMDFHFSYISDATKPLDDSNILSNIETVNFHIFGVRKQN